MPSTGCRAESVTSSAARCGRSAATSNCWPDLPSALLPWRNPVWWQFVSHRLLRLLVPWASIGLAASAVILKGPVYRVALWVQAAFYLLAVAGINRAIAARSASPRLRRRF